MAVARQEPWRADEIADLHYRLAMLHLRIYEAGDSSGLEVYDGLYGSHPGFRDEQILRVDLGCARYYAANYPRGFFAELYALAEFLEEATGGEVLYWPDCGSIDCPTARFDRPARVKLLQFAAHNRQPYGAFSSLSNLPVLRCEQCASNLMVAYQWHEDREHARCPGCETKVVRNIRTGETLSKTVKSG